MTNSSTKHTSGAAKPSPARKPSTDATPSNVDPAELSKFAAMAHTWWDPTGEFRPLHDLNPLRVDYIDAKANVRGKRVLDVGCGGGILSESLAARGAHVVGIDMGEKPLAVAKLHAMESGQRVDYRLVDAESLAAQEPAHYDLVTCLEMLEHVPDPQSVVRACATLTKPGGWVIFSTLNRNPLAYALAVVGAEYVMGLLPRGTHDYAKFIKPSELASMCTHAGLDVIELKGMRYNPLTHSAQLTSDVPVNYLLAARKS